MDLAGTGCTDNSMCTSGYCVDGVCCNGPCTGTCQACSAALTGGIDGVCVNVIDNTDPHDDCPGFTCMNGACTTGGS
jgi:hypothetical protein